MFICDAGYISDGVYMGSAPCPQDRRCRYSGECPNPNKKDASYLGVPKPHISDGVYLGECPSPKVYMGSTPCPQDRTLPLFGEPNPIRKTQAVWESPSPISPMVCIWELPKPRGVYGERPMPPRQTLPLFGRMPEPQSEGRKLFGSPQAPYLRWCVFGRCPSPEVFMGSTPCPQDRRCRYSGSRTQFYIFSFHFSFFIPFSMIPNINWNATAFFKQLTEQNKLAQEQGFKFCRVTGLQGFEEALARLQTATAIIAVDDSSQGYTDLTNSPHTRCIKTVFFAKRHAIDDMAARGRCLDTMREVFRQFMSRLILERTRLEQNAIYLDQRIQFQEIDEYFFSGCACAYFQVAVDTFTDLRFRFSEWENLPEMGAFSPQFTQSYD